MNCSDRSGGLHTTVTPDIDNCHANAWDSMMSGLDDVVMDHRFVRATQNAFDDDVLFWNLLVNDERDHVVAAACFSEYPLDTSMFTAAIPNWLVGGIRRLLPRSFIFRVLFCGLPVSTSESNLRVGDAKNREECLATISRQLTQLAIDRKNLVVVIKEFQETDLVWSDQLLKDGYLRCDSLPMNQLIGDWENATTWRNSLRSHYRYKIEHSQKKLANGQLSIAHCRETGLIRESLDEHAYQLYLSVVNRADHRLEILPLKFFHELTAQFGPECCLTTIHCGPRLVAWAIGIDSPEEFRNLFIGFDLALNQEYDLYFNLMIASLEAAIDRGKARILMGQTANDFKTRLGCKPVPRYYYVRSPIRVLQSMMVRWQKRFFPPASPVLQRRVFK